MGKQDIIEKRLEGESGLDNSSLISNSVYPNAEVRVEKAQFSVLHLKRLCEERKELIIDPDFQRNEVWDSKQKCELIESILMGIPLPVVYLFETKEGKKQVVDGRQRITTILEFLNGKLSLKNLKILPDVKGDISSLDLKLQGIFEDFQISAYIIQPPTPERVKYDIFDRVNRGGTRLNNQEMRNALYKGRATELINELAEEPSFLKATGKGVSTKRMKDRYLILRSISFHLLRTNGFYKNTSEYNKIEYKSDIDDFLAKSMIYINDIMDDSEIVKCKETFIRSMKNIYKFLGEDAFRFETTENRRPINMALFESLMYLFSFNIVAYDYVKDEVDDLKRTFDNTGNFRRNVDSTTSVDFRFDTIDTFKKSIEDNIEDNV